MTSTVLAWLAITYYKSLNQEHGVSLVSYNILQVTQSEDKHGVSMVSYNILQVTQSEDKHGVSIVSYNILQVTQSGARC